MHALRALGLEARRPRSHRRRRPEIVGSNAPCTSWCLVKVALNSRRPRRTGRRPTTPSRCRGRRSEHPPGRSRRLARNVFAALHGVRPAAGDCRPAGLRSLVGRTARHPRARGVQPDDLAVLHYTLGSTGKLEAAMQTVGNRHASLQADHGAYARQPGRTLMLFAAHHARQRHVPSRPCCSRCHHPADGALLVPAEILAAIARHRDHDLHGAGHDPRAAGPRAARESDLSSLRLLSYGAAPMSPSVSARSGTCSGPVLAQGYGAGETTGGVISLGITDPPVPSGTSPNCWPARPAACESGGRGARRRGPARYGGDAIAICGAIVLAGYWRAPEQTRGAGRRRLAAHRRPGPHRRRRASHRRPKKEMLAPAASTWTRARWRR